MIKRRLGSALRARKYQNQCRETVLRAITYNVMIVRIEVFYRALASPFSEKTRVPFFKLFFNRDNRSGAAVRGEDFAGGVANLIVGHFVTGSDEVGRLQFPLFAPAE
jgi:hypothetical protein